MQEKEEVAATEPAKTRMAELPRTTGATAGCPRATNGNRGREEDWPASPVRQHRGASGGHRGAAGSHKEPGTCGDAHATTECSQRTQQPQHQRDQPKGHSLRQQQKLEEPSPPHMDWSRSQGKGDAMHNSRRADPPDETAAGVRAMPPTNTVRGRRRTGQAAKVAEALILSPTGEDPPAARNGRPTKSGMSAGATADKDGPVAPLP
jgi:hypothetical protein